MRKTAYIFLLAAFLFTAGSSFGAKVTNVSLTYENGSTVADIDVEGVILFSHQTEEAKDGKPFRIIVDVLSATQELGARNFLTLPDCQVQHIRTSQYRVRPEKIVRLVFDMKGETIYRIQSQGKKIRVSFAGKSDRPFAVWSSLEAIKSQKAVSKPTIPIATIDPPTKASLGEKSSPFTIAMANQEIEADRQESLQGKSPVKKSVVYEPDAVSKATPEVKSLPKSDELLYLSPKSAMMSSKPKKDFAPDLTAAHTEPQKESISLEVPSKEVNSEAKSVTFAESRRVSAAKDSASAVSPAAELKSELVADNTAEKITDKKADAASSGKVEVAAIKEPVKPAEMTTPASSSSGTTDTKEDKTDGPKILANQPNATKPAEKTTPASSSTSSAAKSVDKKDSHKVFANQSNTARLPQKESSGAVVSKNVKKLATSKLTKQPVIASTESKPKVSAEKSTVKKSKKKKTVAKIVKSSKSTKKSSPKVASKPSDSNKSGKGNARSTSRFRRSASNKIKGTLVAEFPKRLVIKYKAKGRRDPFATLVDETKVNNSIIEAKVPNVEGLTLVGVIESGEGNNRALFEDTDGYGYILKSGDKVKKGYVLRVEPERVYFQIFEYGWSRTVALNLEID